jgi:foldase protein PrsA
MLALLPATACASSTIVVRLSDGTSLTLDLPDGVSDIHSLGVVREGNESETVLWAKADEGDPVIAVVNGEEISRQSFVDKLEDAAGMGVLAQMIGETLISQAAREAGISVEPPRVKAEIAKLRAELGPSFESVLAQYGMTEQDLAESVELSLLVFDLSTAHVSLTEEDLRRYFEEHRAEYEEPEQVRASHILVETEEEAREVQRLLSEGADFAELAREWSIDRGSSVRGGDLGFFARGAMVRAFEDTAFSLAPGQISEPVQTEYGYHIVHVTDRVDVVPAVFEEMRDYVERAIRSQYAKSPQDLAAELWRKSVVVINDPRYVVLQAGMR